MKSSQKKSNLSFEEIKLIIGWIKVSYTIYLNELKWYFGSFFCNNFNSQKTEGTKEWRNNITFIVFSFESLISILVLI
jgi:hypothetical protein